MKYGVVPKANTAGEGHGATRKQISALIVSLKTSEDTGCNVYVLGLRDYQEASFIYLLAML